MNRNYSIGLLILILGALPFIPARWSPILSSAAGADYSDVKIETLELNNLAFASPEANSVYLSDPVSAPFAFNAVVPAWESQVLMGVEIRTGRDGRWGEWIPLQENHDFSQDKNDNQFLNDHAHAHHKYVGDMIFVPVADLLHEQVQFRVWMGDPSRMGGFDLTFIDSTDGPNDAEIFQRQAELNAQNGVSREAAGVDNNPKPSVISREVWCIDSRCDCPPEGCDDECLDDDPLEYQNVTHLVVHHTVSSNEAANWADKVRAIWSFHAFGRCWGDIGYNYLIDMNGVIYEGHRGGDDVVGTHASGANTGSMGVSLIGTFTLPTESPPGIRPPDAMLNSLIDIMAWKADEKQIDPYDSGTLPFLGKRPNLMGHRDVYGTTTCPGQQTHDLIPWLRQQIDARLTFDREAYVYIDELSSAFSRSNVNWFTGARSCGYNGHAWYTWSVSSAANSTNWGEWNIDVAEDSYYEVQANVPYCLTGTSETDSAKYTVTHANGTTDVVMSHNDVVGGWSTIGQFSFSADANGRLRLTDLTQDDGYGVWFDAIRLRKVGQPEPAAAPQSPSGGEQLTEAEVDFNWRLTFPELINSIQIVVATDSSFTDVVHSADLATDANSYALTFDRNYEQLYWRIEIESTEAEMILSTAEQFSVDFLPDPIINLISPVGDSWFSGSDISFSWEALHFADVTTTTLTIARDVGMTDIVNQYEFANLRTGETVSVGESDTLLYWQITVDAATNLSSAIGSFGIDTQSPSATVAAVYRFENGDFAVKVTAVDSGSGVQGYDVEYRAEGSSEWTLLQADTNQRLISFVPPNSAVGYAFRATATDNAGNREAAGDGELGTADSLLLMPINLLPLASSK